MPYKGGTVCISRSCASNSRFKNVSMFRIPRDSERARQWLKNAGRTDLLSKTSEELVKNYRLCELHFEPKWFTSEQTDSRKRILNKAVPTLFTHADPLADTEQLQGALGDEPIKKVIILSDLKVLPVLDLSAMEASRSSKSLRANAAKYQEFYSAVPGASGTRPDSSLQQSEIEIIIPDPSSSSKTSASLMSPVETQMASSFSYNSPRKEELRHQVKSFKRKLTLKKQKQDEESSHNLEDFDNM